MGMLVIGKFIRIKRNTIKLSTGKILKGKPVYLLSNRQWVTFPFSVGQPKTQGQIYTGVAYQDDIECS
jgi:hypothetical protein